jgi:hypothetical protein
VCRLWQDDLKKSGKLASAEASAGYRIKPREEYKVNIHPLLQPDNVLVV